MPSRVAAPPHGRFVPVGGSAITAGTVRTMVSGGAPTMGATLPDAHRLPAPGGLRAPRDRLVYVSSESGVYQVHAWDRVAWHHRQVTNHPIGVIEGDITLDGDRVVFWQDETGSEAGRWVRPAVRRR